jgi:hypothetical protein
MYRNNLVAIDGTASPMSDRRSRGGSRLADAISEGAHIGGPKLAVPVLIVSSGADDGPR